MPQTTQKPRVLFINRSYWPDVEATGQLLTELCEDLAPQFDVHVLCGQPQQVAEGVDFDRTGTTRRNGVTIHRTRHTQFDKASFFGRMANMLTFQAACCWRALRVPRPDVEVTETDPPFLCLLGWLLKFVYRCRFICYLQDIYPDVAVALGKLRESWKTRLLRRLFFAAYRRSDAVVVLSRDMQKLVVESDVLASQVHVIRNWVDTEAIYPVKENNRFRGRHGLGQKFVVMYSGNLGLSQRLEQLLQAAAALRDRHEIVFALVGNGAERAKLERLAADQQLANVRFFDYQPKSELADSLSAADVHIVVLRPEIKRLLMPSKMYGVLASGTPALVLTDKDCELASIVAEHDLGAFVESDDNLELTKVIAQYADSPERVRRQSRAARQYAEANCRREASVDQFRKILDGLSELPGITASLVELALTSQEPSKRNQSARVSGCAQYTYDCVRRLATGVIGYL